MIFLYQLDRVFQEEKKEEDEKEEEGNKLQGKALATHLELCVVIFFLHEFL